MNPEGEVDEAIDVSRWTPATLRTAAGPSHLAASAITGNPVGVRGRHSVVNPKPGENMRRLIMSLIALALVVTACSSTPDEAGPATSTAPFGQQVSRVEAEYGIARKKPSHVFIRHRCKTRLKSP